MLQTGFLAPSTMFNIYQGVSDAECLKLKTNVQAFLANYGTFTCEFNPALQHVANLTFKVKSGTIGDEPLNEIKNKFAGSKLTATANGALLLIPKKLAHLPDPADIVKTRKNAICAEALFWIVVLVVGSLILWGFYTNSELKTKLLSEITK